MMPTTVNDDGLKNSLAVSSGLHLLVFLFLYFGLPVLMKPLPKPHVSVPFEIVEIAELTNTRIKEDNEPAQPPAPPPPPPPEKTQPAVAPAPKVPEKVETIALPKPQEKPKPPEEKKSAPDSLNNLLRDVAKLKPQPQAKPAEAKPDAKQETPAEVKTMAPALSSRLTISEEDALRRQIENEWNMPIGARDVQNLIVQVEIDVNPDRTVRSADIVDKSRMASDPFYRTAAEAALRAVNNFRYKPLELPPDKYDQWKHITFTFDPRNIQ